MANENEIEVPKYLLDEIEIPEDFLKNSDFILDLEVCFNDLKKENPTISDEKLKELLQKHIEIGREYVTLYIEREGTKEIAEYRQLDKNTFLRTGMIKQVQNNMNSEPVIHESLTLNKLGENGASTEYSCSKETNIGSYAEGIQTINNTKLDEIKNLITREESQWDNIENNYEESQTPNLGDKTAYIAKKTGLGVASGVLGIYQAILTESADQLKQGANMTDEEMVDARINDNRINFSTTQSPVLPDIATIAKRVPILIPKVKEIWNDQEKSFTGKLGAIYTEYMSEALNSIPLKQDFNRIMNEVGHAIPETGNTVEKVNNTISRPVQTANEALYYEGQEYGKVTQTLGNVGQVIGNMAPSITASIVSGNPGVGLGVMGLSSKGQSTQEALSRGAELNEAVKVGNAKAMVEVGTEMMFSGINIFGKGALDDIIEKGILDKVKNEVGQELAKRGINIAGEVVEETISDIVGTYIDQGTIDPNAEYKLSDWKDTAVTTILSTMVLNGITNTISRQTSNKQTTVAAQTNQTTEQRLKTEEVVNLLNSDLTLENAVELLKIDRDSNEPTLSNAIQYKLQNFNLLSQAQQIFKNDQTANNIYSQIKERPFRIQQIQEEIANNPVLQEELEERRKSGEGNIDEFMAVYVEAIEQNSRGRYYEDTSSIEHDNTSKATQKDSESKIGQITETQNKLYVEYEGFFKDPNKSRSDFMKIESKYANKNFQTDDIDVILSDYDGQKYSYLLANEMMSRLQDITHEVNLNWSEIDKVVNVLSEVNKNVPVQNQTATNQNLREALFSGQTTKDGLDIIRRTALEVNGIDTRNYQVGSNQYTQLKIDGEWYNLDSILEEANLKARSEDTKKLPENISEKVREIAEKNNNAIPGQSEQSNIRGWEKLKSLFQTEQTEEQSLEPRIIKRSTNTKR